MHRLSPSPRLLALAVAVLVSLTACFPQPLPATAPLPAGPAAASLSTGASETGGAVATVTKVVDGDTIDVAIGGLPYKLRYIGIDCPELGSVASGGIAKKAADKNQELVGGKTVELEKDVSETDRYGRLLRYVYSGGVMVNAELVKLGFARAGAYPPDIKYQGLFNGLQSEAKAAGLGIWESQVSDPAATPGGKGLYVGSRRSDKYHHPTCEWALKISPSNEVWFSSSEEARSQHYVPCKSCSPP